MLSPKRTKFQKYQKGKSCKKKQNLQTLAFGKFGVKALANCRLPARTLEAVRRVITRKVKRSGFLWIRVFPDIPVTKKPAEVRMGKGKGSVAYWQCRVARGQILFELDGVSKAVAQEALLSAEKKLPIALEFISLE